MAKRVGEFEKVSFEQFETAMHNYYEDEYEKSLEVFGRWFKWLFRKRGKESIADILDEVNKDTTIAIMHGRLQLPKRATDESAGHDFNAPFDFTLYPGETIKIPTGVRVKINSGWWLGCVPRSSLGFKYRVQLDNTVGVIDGDYYHTDNEGHIFAKITNDSRDCKVITVKQGEAFMQGIFIPYGITYSDNVTTVRTGGIGSTNKK